MAKDIKKEATRVVFSIVFILIEIYSFTFFLSKQFFSLPLSFNANSLGQIFSVDLINLLNFLPIGIFTIIFFILILTFVASKKNKGKSIIFCFFRSSLSLLPLVFLPLTLFYNVVEGRVMLSALPASICALLAWHLCCEGDERSETTWGRWEWLEKQSNILTFAVCSFFFLLFLSICIARHRSHWSSLIDLGLFFEIYHNAENRFMYAPSIGQSFFGEHFSPVLVLLWPFMKVFPSPITLLTIQAISVSVGGYLLWLLAKERVENKLLSFAIMLSYISNPYIQQSVYYDFHIDMLEPPMIMGLMLAINRNKHFWAWICAILLWCTKEDTFIYTTIITLYAMISRRKLMPWVLIFLFGIIQAIFILGWFLPHFRAPFSPEFYSTTGPAVGYAFFQRYSHLGRNFSEILRNLFFNTSFVFKLLTDNRTVSSIFALIIPFGGLAILGGVSIILLIPSLEMLLGHPSMAYFEYYYGGTVMPFAAIGAVEGGRNFLQFFSRRVLFSDLARKTGIAIFAMNAGIFFWHPSSYFSTHRQYQPYIRTNHQIEAERFMSQVPAGAKVSSTGYLAVHMQKGRDVSMFPFGVEKADYILIDMQRPPWPVDFWDVQETLQRMVLGGVFCIKEISDDGLILLQRKAIDNKCISNTPVSAEKFRKWLDEPVVEAELTELTRFRGREKRDRDASNGAYISVSSLDSRGEGHIIYGPYAKLSTGKYVAKIKMRWMEDSIIAHPESYKVVTIDVKDSRKGVVKAIKVLSVYDLQPVKGKWFVEEVPFSVGVGESNFEVRLWYHDNGRLDVDVIRIKKVE